MPTIKYLALFCAGHSHIYTKNNMSCVMDTHKNLFIPVENGSEASVTWSCVVEKLSPITVSTGCSMLEFVTSTGFAYEWEFVEVYWCRPQHLSRCGQLWIDGQAMIFNVARMWFISENTAPSSLQASLPQTSQEAQLRMSDQVRRALLCDTKRYSA